MEYFALGYLSAEDLNMSTWATRLPGVTYRLIRLTYSGKTTFAEHLNISNAMILSGGSAGRIGVTSFMEHVTLRD